MIAINVLQSVHLLLGHDLQIAWSFYKHLLVDTVLVIMFSECCRLHPTFGVTLLTEYRVTVCWMELEVVVCVQPFQIKCGRAKSLA